jgi:hypothetical protein
MGRPLLGQWCWDAIRAVDYLVTRRDVDAHRLAVVGAGVGGLAAICVGAFDERIAAVAATDTLASFVSAGPFKGHRMASFVPFLLDVADVPHLAALLAPRRLILARPVDAQSQPLDADARRAVFGFTEQVYDWYRAAQHFRIVSELSPEQLSG